MPSSDPKEELRHRDALVLMAELCTQAASIVNSATVRGEKMGLKQAFAQAASTHELSRDDLTRLWALFLLASQAAKELHWELVKHDMS
jgi:hypothetical protein